MYLSQLILNPRSRLARAELARPYELHRSVMSGFKAHFAEERVLYRLDISTRDAIPRLLVQSRFEPDWAFLSGRADYLMDLPDPNPQVRLYDPQLAAGQRLAFRLLANPTRSQASAPLSTQDGQKARRERGKRVTIGLPDDQAAWLERKAAAGGFRLGALRISSLGEQRLSIPQPEGHAQPARHWSVRFDGELEVLDPLRFRRTLEDGIGSAKGFGYGLLTVAPL